MLYANLKHNYCVNSKYNVIYCCSFLFCKKNIAKWLLFYKIRNIHPTVKKKIKQR